MSKSKYFSVLFLLFLTAIALCGCQQEPKLANQPTEVQYESGIYRDKNWDNPVGKHKGDAIPNAECAIEVATAIYKASISDNKTRVPGYVFFDEEDFVWIVHFFRCSNEEGVEILGGDITIVLRQADGAVLGIWHSE